MTSPATHGPSRLRRGGHIVTALRWVAAVVVVCVLLATAATARLFVWPGNEAPGRADAVFVLSGDHGERLPVGLDLVRRGVAPVLVLDGDPDLAEVGELCKGGASFEVVCLRPDPDGTRPEAQAAGKLAAARQWKAIVVVTSTQHGTRAGLLFRRCLPGPVSVVRAKPPFDRRTMVGQILHEMAATAYLVTIGPRGC